MLAYKKNNAVLINTITRGIDDSHFGNIKGQVALVRGVSNCFWPRGGASSKSCGKGWAGDTYVLK